MSYSHQTIDQKWQKKWEEAQVFRSEENSTKPKYYALDMFPYPSGLGLHVGHLASYTPTDIIARFKRAKGFNVLHPMGWDAFGLPAEQYAIKTGIHPAETTNNATTNFKSELKRLGLSFDWNREISTCDSKYYKWTQFIFLKLFEKGLAYQKEVPVNWCPALRTVLANEEVVDGKSERGGHPVVRLPMKQWMLKITAYAERLLEGLNKIDWPERTKEGQRNWIGKSVGAEIDFSLEGHAEKLRVFTTRPDTIFGATFMVLAPEHSLVEKITTKDQKQKVDEYVEKASKKSEVDRKANKEKTGIFTGAFALNPFNKKKIPIWIADYVLTDYGTGAIMAVPGHDERDFEFAKEFGLEIVRVLESETDLPFIGDGKHVNSDFINGTGKDDGINKVIERLEKEKIGIKTVNYKFRDWLISRQRYWGEPIPIIHYPEKIMKAVPTNELPVLLPEVADYQPSEKGEAPLARAKDWMNYKGEGTRDTDTMAGSAGSSWYFLRYCDPNNDKAAFDFEKQKYWMPVDLYVGGPEHTVGHLLYSRFWQKVLFDAGLVSSDEPFQKLVHQGVILGPDGERMSKSRGNVVNLDDTLKNYGADASRVYILFLGPLEKDKPWSDSGIDGVRRFLDRIWRLGIGDDGKNVSTDEALSEGLNKALHKTIKKVTEDIETLNFNTAISSMMILVNEAYKENCRSKKLLAPLLQLLAPFAPHVAEEIWTTTGNSGFVSVAPWPSFDKSLVIDDIIELGVQINGKTRGTINVAPDADENTALTLTRSNNSLAKHLDGKTIVKTIYKAGKILNIIIK
ncbi:MAG: leucine--tRNA ligase [Proteobacteria bacterium SG_bin7]|nr:MAG: leucine--tRNA ligase [Proteobacteria bacterium SG_bin7]